MIRKSEVGRWLNDPVTREVVSLLKEVDREIADKCGRGSCRVDDAFSAELYAEAQGSLDLLSLFDLDGKPFLDLLNQYEKLDDDTEDE